MDHAGQTQARGVSLVPALIMFEELRLSIASWMFLPVFLPQQHQRDATPRQFPMNLLPVRYRAFCLQLDFAIRKQFLV